MVRAGGDTWFFITADYAFGHALERDTADFVRAAGGRVLGQVRTPFPGTTDFSSFLVQAQASRRQGDRPRQCRRRHHQLHQAGGGVRPARGAASSSPALLMFLTDVHALGLQTAQGLVCTETFYWDLNDRTRAFTNDVTGSLRRQRAARMVACRLLRRRAALPEGGGGHGRGGRPRPDGAAAVARMKAMPTDDDCFGARQHPPGRAQDPPRLPLRGEEARGVEGPLGLLQAAADHAGGRGLPAARRGRLRPGP